MKIRLLYFAVLRDIVGESEQEVTLKAGSRPSDVWDDLRSKHPQLNEYRHPPMTAINQAYASPDQPLNEGDELAFIPPVAGG